MEQRSVNDIIENLQKQIDQLKGQTLVSYPWKAGDKVILPADEQGHRKIIVVPNHNLAVANIALIKGAELYEGEVPKCGFIIDNRVHRAFTPAFSPKEEKEAPPADFATNKPDPMTEKEQIAAVMAIIPLLKTNDYTKTGQPLIASLSREAKFDVKAEVRDAAWPFFQKMNPDHKPEPAPVESEPAVA